MKARVGRLFVVSLLTAATLLAAAPLASAGDAAKASDDLASLRSEVVALRGIIEVLQVKVAEQEERLRAFQPVAGARAASSAAPSAGSVKTAPGESPPAEEGQRPTSATQSDLEKKLAEELGTSTEQPASAPSTPGWTPAQPIVVAGGEKSFVNLSFDVLAAGGTSTRRDVDEIEKGGHDPIQRGFTLQNVETVLEGAVDPYFRGQGNIVLQLDKNGETSVEIEEAYLTSTSLPHNLQVKGGQFFTEFGRLNPQHPHTWDFVDQPLVNGRFLGGDGLREPGVRASWLLPTPFYSELFLTVQNSQGETATSFRNVPGETLFGRVIQERHVETAGDLLYVPRYSASFDLSDTQTVLAGASAALGPNGTGTDTRTNIYGIDLFWKWKPVNSLGGFPFLKWQTEGMYRRYEAGAFVADTDGDGVDDVSLPAETLEDWGAYSQLVWGFKQGWTTGLRGDYVTAGKGSFTPDPTRQTRWRLSPDLSWYPTEFSKLRLQFNHDHAEDEGSDESIWLQMEFTLGAHAAHKF